jgi:hypothetical protein
MRKFSWKIFVVSTVLITALLIFSFGVAWGDDDGTLTKKSYLQIFVKIFYILRFPTHTLFWNYIITHESAFLFCGTLFINCLLYALIIERLIYFFKKMRNSSD